MNGCRKQVLALFLVCLLFSSCAYQSTNLLEVKAKKFRYGMLISCTDCEVKLQRNMDTNKQGENNEKTYLNSNLTVGD